MQGVDPPGSVSVSGKDLGVTPFETTKLLLLPASYQSVNCPAVNDHNSAEASCVHSSSEALWCA
jgi:hypothetical protein